MGEYAPQGMIIRDKEPTECKVATDMNYQEAYYRQVEQIKELQVEVINLKKALLNVALKL